MKLLDANIIMYAIGKPHPCKVPCTAIMAQAVRHRDEFNIDLELLQEILHTFGARNQREEGASQVADLLELFPHAMPVGAGEIKVAMSLFSRHPRLSARDAIHAAVVQVHGLEGIVSADRAFDSIPGFKRFDPLEMASA